MSKNHILDILGNLDIFETVISFSIESLNRKTQLPSQYTENIKAREFHGTLCTSNNQTGFRNLSMESL